MERRVEMDSSFADADSQVSGPSRSGSSKRSLTSESNRLAALEAKIQDMERIMTGLAPGAPRTTSPVTDEPTSSKTRRSRRISRRETLLHEEGLSKLLPETPAPKVERAPSKIKMDLPAVHEASKVSGLTLQTPFKFKIEKPLEYISMKSLMTLEQDLSKYHARPQNAGQNVYLWSDEYLTAKLREYVMTQLYARYSATEFTVTNENDLINLDDTSIVGLLRVLLQPKDRKESAKIINETVESEMRRLKSQLHDYNYSKIPLWASVIKRVFSLLRWYFDKVQPESDAKTATMKGNKQLGVKGLGETVPELLFPEKIRTAVYSEFMTRKLITEERKNFASLTQYMNAVDIVLDDLVKKHREHRQLIEATEQTGKYGKMKETINLLCGELSVLSAEQQLAVSTQLIEQESFDDETATVLASELTSLSASLSESDELRLCSLAASDKSILDVVCFRFVNKLGCTEKKCPYSHDFRDVALYHRFRLKEAEHMIQKEEQQKVQQKMHSLTIESKRSVQQPAPHKADEQEETGTVEDHE